MLGFSQLTISVVIVSSEQERYSGIHRHVFILPQTPLSSRLPRNTEQSSMCYTVGPCWLSILNVTVQTPFLMHRFLSQSLFPYYICHSFFIEKVKESEVTQSCLTLCDPMDSSLHQDPLSIGFSRQEYCSGLPLCPVHQLSRSVMSNSL